MTQYLAPGAGQELLLDNCGTCHSALCPVFGQRDAAHWQSIKVNHKSRVTGMSDADFNTLFDYLTTNYNDTKPEPNVPPEVKQNASCSAGF